MRPREHWFAVLRIDRPVENVARLRHWHRRSTIGALRRFPGGADGCTGRRGHLTLLETLEEQGAIKKRGERCDELLAAPTMADDGAIYPPNSYLHDVSRGFSHYPSTL